jgi:hypothetical protein
MDQATQPLMGLRHTSPPRNASPTRSLASSDTWKHDRPVGKESTS